MFQKKTRDREGGGYVKSHEYVPFLFIGDGETACRRITPFAFFDEIFKCVRR
jgi:hypothetical protein